jgi:hypothetical protein
MTRRRSVRTRFELSLTIAAAAVVIAGCPDFDAVSNGGPPCEGGTRCGRVCVDLASDAMNCGTCGNACVTGRCGLGLTADMTSPPANWLFNGSAAYDPNAQSAVLTPTSSHSAAGTAVYAHPLAADSFDLTFDFRMGFGGGSRADGMGFMIETSGANAVGTVGAGLGMTGLEGYGVEFDIFNNAMCGDSSADHVAVDSLGPCSAVQPNTVGLPVDLVGRGVDLGNGNWHSAAVKAQGGTFTVSVDGLVLLDSVALPGFVMGSDYYFGFSGAVGLSGGYRSEVRKVQLSFPSPRCL